MCAKGWTTVRILINVKWEIFQTALQPPATSGDWTRTDGDIDLTSTTPEEHHRTLPAWRHSDKGSPLHVVGCDREDPLRCPDVVDTGTSPRPSWHHGGVKSRRLWTAFCCLIDVKWADRRGGVRWRERKRERERGERERDWIGLDWSLILKNKEFRQKPSLTICPC